MKLKIHDYQNKYLRMSKNKITILIALLIATLSFAQQGINYKAVIKDDLGNVLANTNNISVQFTVYKGDGLTNQVYQETHTNVSTDGNGIIITTIGEGNTSDDFSSINWGSDSHWLNTQIDIGSGLADLGTTEFMAVPYALSAGNVSGLESLYEGGNTGWRLIGSNPTSYGIIGNMAIDLSISDEDSDTRGATGYYSTAMGHITTASGYHSTAMGYLTTASGNNSTAMGIYTTAPSYFETTIGSYNTDYTPIGTTYWNANDRVFVIGKGFSSASKSDALIVLKNGTITAPSFSISEIDTAGDKALITKEYADTNYLTIESAETNYLSSSGDVSIEGELQQTSTGNANLVPLAYGTVDSNGDTVTGTGNFTAFLSSNVFIIDVNEAESLSYGNTVCLITPISTAPRTASTVISDGNGDGDADLNVRIFNASGTQVLTTFQFVIYKL
jgi:hypothetical protein